MFASGCSLHFSVLLLLALSFFPGQAVAAVFNCVGGSVYVVAHPDDDLLFQSPDIVTDVKGGNCITTVFLTSGDSGVGSTYARSRESGNEAAYASMLGVRDSYTEFTAVFGGQPVLVRTLVSAPRIQKVYFRLPDGNVDGSGYSSTGYQSLRGLYFGQISSISNSQGTATYTYDTLRQAIGEILQARKATRVRTLDDLSQYDAGDHSDHLTAGRITASLVGKYAAGAAFSGYMGYPINNLPPSFDSGSAEFLAKSSAFFAYTPYDTAECQSYSLCSSAGRAETFWLLRQYVVTPALATTSTIGSAQVPAVMPIGGQDVARLATASASSTYPGQPPASAIDGNIAGYPGNSSAEWVAASATLGTTFTVSWGTDVYNITSVVLYDRPNTYDQITGGTLTFSPSSQSITFGALYNDGSATVVNLAAPILTSSITMTVTSVSYTTGLLGLSEFAAFGVLAKNATAPITPVPTPPNNSTLYSAFNLAGNATAVASSESGSTGQTADKAIDGYVDGFKEDGTGVYWEEWASGSGVGTTLRLTWRSAVSIARVVLYDRPNLSDQITGAQVSWNGGSVYVGALKNDGSATYVDLPVPANTTYLLLTVTAVSSTTGSAGLAEIECFALASSSTGPPTSSSIPSATSASSSSTSSVASATSSAGAGNGVNLALRAVATASSETAATEQTADKAIDGYIDGYKEDNSGTYFEEWASGTGVGTTLTLTWTSPVTISSVVLYDRPNLSDNIRGGTLSFADGSSVTFGALNNDGSATVVSLPQSVLTTRLVMTVTAVSSSTGSAGLAEIQVFGSSSTTVTATSPPVSSTSTSTASASSTRSSSATTSAPVSVPTGINLALQATATASSETSATEQTADKAIDGYIDGYKEDNSGTYFEEWASGSGVGTTLTLTWASPISISSVVLYDRPNLSDNIQGGTLTFSDGSSVTFGALKNDGSATVVALPRSVTTLRLVMTITAVSSSTSSAGLAEIQVYGVAGATTSATSAPVSSTSTVVSSTTSSTSSATATTSAPVSLPTGVNLALSATATASSETPGTEQTADKVNDGFVDGYKEDGTGMYMEEWASGGGVGTTLTLTWASPVTISSVVLYDRPNLSDNIRGGTLSFSDGTSVTFGPLVNDGSATIVTLPRSVTTTRLVVTVTSVSATTGSAGLAEIEVYGSAAASSALPTSSSATSVVLPSSSTSSTPIATSASASPTSSSPLSSIVSTSRTSASMSFTQTTMAPPSSSASSSSQTTTIVASSSSSSTSLPAPPTTSATSSSTPFTTSTTTTPTASSITTTSRTSTTTSVTAPSPSTTSPQPSTTAPPPTPTTSRATTATTSASPTGFPTAPPQASNVNIARFGKATASSFRSSSPPSGVNDGNIGGLDSLGLGIASQEWSTGNRNTPAWVQLDFTSAYQIQTIYLFPPRGLLNTVNAGTLTFDNGNTISVGKLSSSGTAISVGTRTIKSVRFTITQTGLLSNAVGLSEMKIYNAKVVQNCSLLDPLCLLDAIL